MKKNGRKLGSGDVGKFCQICKVTYDGNYFAEHFIKHHLNYKPYICLVQNCHGEFTTEETYDLHCKFKHDGVKSTVLNLGNKFVDWIVQWFQTRDNIKLVTAKRSNVYAFMESNPLEKVRKILDDLENNFLLGKSVATTSDKNINDNIDQNSFKNDSNITKLVKKDKLKNIDFLQDVNPEQVVVALNNQPPRKKRDKIVLEVFNHLKVFLAVKNNVVNKPTDGRKVRKRGKKSPRWTVIKKHKQKNEIKKLAPRVKEGRITKKKILLEPKSKIKKIVASSKKKSVVQDSPKHIRCKICKKFLLASNGVEKRHCFQHVDAKWLYRCALCTRQGREPPHETLYFDTLRKHLIRVHGMKKQIKPDKHYVLNAELPDEKIEEIKKLCFPSLS